MARTAMVDTEIGGKPIKAGERVAMWYISGNRDEEAIPERRQVHRSIARTRVITCRSASAFIAASATGSASCSCA